VDPVIDQVTLDGKRYLVLEQLGSRDRFRVFDSTAGFHGDYRVLDFLPRSREMEQQIEVLRRLAEKNLHFPKIIQCVRQGNKLGVVSTWIWGIDLRDYLGQVRGKKIVRPSTREVCRLVNKLAHGLAHLHVKLNIVHGDIKPANIVLEKDPTRLVLIDFGSAWPAERAAKKSPGDGVSFPYVAPEQLISDTVPDFRADIFSLSVVLFELLTLDIPFDGAGGQAGLPENRAEFSAKYQPPSKFITDAHLLPIGCVPILDKILERGLALDRNGRFSDRNDWLRAMDDLIFQFREGTRLGFFSRKFLGLLDWWSNWRKGSGSSG
jgi:serine/threonine protein kinase